MSQITTVTMGGGGSGVLTITGDTGGAIMPSSGTIVLTGGTTGYTFVGSGHTETLTASGPMTNSLQPAFSYYANASIANVTGDSTTYTMVFNTKIFDNDNNFDGVSTFTAPVSGIYLLCYGIQIQGATVANSADMYIFTTGIYYSGNDFASLTNGDNSFYSTVVAKMSAGDTAYIDLTISGGTKTVSILGQAGDARTFFSGYLVA